MLAARGAVRIMRDTNKYSSIFCPFLGQRQAVVFRAIYIPFMLIILNQKSNNESGAITITQL